MRNDINIPATELLLLRAKEFISCELIAEGNALQWGLIFEGEHQLLFRLIESLERQLIALKKDRPLSVSLRHFHRLQDKIKSLIPISDNTFSNGITIKDEGYDPTLEFDKFKNNTDNYEFTMEILDNNCDLSLDIRDSLSDDIYKKLCKNIITVNIDTIDDTCIMEYILMLQSVNCMPDVKYEDFKKNCQLNYNYGSKKACITDIGTYQALVNCGLRYSEISEINKCKADFKFMYCKGCIYAYSDKGSYNLCDLKISVA